MSVKEIDSLKKNPLEHEGTTIVSNVTEGKNSNKKAYIEGYGIIKQELGSVDIIHLNVVLTAGLFALYLKRKYQIP